MSDSPVSEPYRSGEQQHQSAMMGMYIFLGSEIMLFGGLMAVATSLRLHHPSAYVEASRALHYGIGGFNTLVLLTSSLMVALAVEAARQGNAASSARWFRGGAALGIIFLVVKAYEYRKEFEEGLLPLQGVHAHFFSDAQHLFMDLYVVTTALHALHLAVGVLLLSGLSFAIGGGKVSLPHRAIIPMTFGLYWHFVDIVWVFLYPLLYLAR